MLHGRGGPVNGHAAAEDRRPEEAIMLRLLKAARDKARANAGDILAAVAVAAYFLGFFGAVHLALAKLSY